VRRIDELFQQYIEKIVRFEQLIWIWNIIIEFHSHRYSTDISSRQYRDTVVCEAIHLLIPHLHC
jgi:hypothetical protein